MSDDQLRRMIEAGLPPHVVVKRERESEADPETWFACEHPERPPDGKRTGYHEGCYGCAVAAEARARTDPSTMNRTMADVMWAMVKAT